MSDREVFISLISFAVGALVCAFIQTIGELLNENRDLREKLKRGSND